jgi:prefoldin subunit 5
MLQRILMSLSVAVAALALVPRLSAIDEKIHEGKVVSVAADGKLVMTDKEGKNEHTHMVPAGAKITIDGKAARLVDLKQGDAVKVTVDAAGKVSAIAALQASKS